MKTRSIRDAAGITVELSEHMDFKNYFVPSIVLVVVLVASCDLNSTAPDENETETMVAQFDTIDIQVHFNEKLREGVIERVGQPIEGFVPIMFLQAFPGLVPVDFDGVDALLGSTNSQGTTWICCR